MRLSRLRWVHGLALGWIVLSVGCLKTREDLKAQEETRYSQPPAAQAPPPMLAVEAPPADINEEMRKLNGRVEVLEHELQTLKASQQQEQQASATREQELTSKIALLTETLVQLEAKVGQPAAVTPTPAAVETEVKNPWLEAESEFKAKNYRQAIELYQKYRAQSPNGRNYPAATYKIAVCFQELGMKQEARVFFDEVIARFPSSEFATRARFRVKQLR